MEFINDNYTFLLLSDPVYTREFYLPFGFVSHYIHSLLVDLLCNGYSSKVRACKGFILQVANRSLLFSTVIMQLKENPANKE